MGFISTLSLFLPILFIIALRLWNYRTFPALLVYYFIAFTFNLRANGYIHTNDEVKNIWNLCNNLLDAPLMLLFLTYFSTSPVLTQRIKWTIGLIIVFELAVVALTGFNNKAVSIFMGPSLLAVLGFCIYFFVRQTRITVTHRKGLGKSIISAALLFSYGCYFFIYLMFYVFQTHLDHGVIKQQDLADTYLIYFISVTLSSLLITAGIYLESIRIQKLHELKKTRQELSLVYKDTKKAVPFRTAMLDFDKDAWN
jgi:hypothetical protein